MDGAHPRIIPAGVLLRVGGGGGGGLLYLTWMAKKLMTPVQYTSKFTLS